MVKHKPPSMACSQACEEEETPKPFAVPCCTYGSLTERNRKRRKRGGKMGVRATPQSLRALQQAVDSSRPFQAEYATEEDNSPWKVSSALIKCALGWLMVG